MIPENLNWPVDPYLLGGIVLMVGVVLGAIGFQIKRTNVERQRDRLYVQRQRGEELPVEDPPQVATVLEYVGSAVALVGIALLLAAWSSSAGQS